MWGSYSFDFVLLAGIFRTLSNNGKFEWMMEGLSLGPRKGVDEAISQGLSQSVEIFGFHDLLGQTYQVVALYVMLYHLHMHALASR